MHESFLYPRIAVSALAALAGVVFLFAALRVRRSREASALARYGVAVFVSVIAALVALRALEPVIAYSFTCFSLVVVPFADLLRDEHARRRRVALLAPRPTADRVPTVWIVITVLSTLTLVPYVLGGIVVLAALITGGCAIAMAAIAWCIASAPTQLTGEDPQTEHLRELADRARQIGLTCLVAIGSVAVFLSFVNASPPPVGGVGRVTDVEMLLVWAALWIWQAWYVRRVSDSACTVCS